MAGTITATLSAISTLFSSAVPTLSTASATDATTDTPESTSSSLTSSISISPMKSVTPVPLPTTLSASTGPQSSVMSSVHTSTTPLSTSSDLSASEASSKSTVSTSSLDGPTSASSTSSVTSTATAAAATESAKKEHLSTSAIAGIVTASVVTAALLLAYLAYVCIVKRKNRDRRRSQRFSSFFPPDADNDKPRAGTAVDARTSRNTLPADASKRFYAGGTTQTKRQSLWPRSYLPPDSIGVAVAPSRRVSPEPWTMPKAHNRGRVSRSSPILVTGSKHYPNEIRWSIATSFDEDIEAQTQDVPILGSPKTRSSARSFSSAGIEKPAPLHLSRMRVRSESPPTVKLQLTPVYDNGCFEPTIRQVFNEPLAPGAAALAVRHSEEQQPLNFSRRDPTFGRTSQDESRPFWSQNRKPPLERFPVKPAYPPVPVPVAARKQSEASGQSISMYTEIEEDDTSEVEADKQLQMPVPPQPSGLKRSPIQDLQWPQIPRSASIAKQATKPHSPRAIKTIRQVDPFTDSPPARQSMTARAQAALDAAKARPTPVQSESFSTSSSSPVFPMPPPRRQPFRRVPTLAQGTLARQISDAYKVASRPITATTSPSTNKENVPQYPPNAYRSPPKLSQAQPGVTYQQIQRLSTGRPLAQKLQMQGYTPRPKQQTTNRKQPPPFPLARSTSMAKITPTPGQEGEMWFRVGNMER